MIQNNDIIPELSIKDKEFSLRIADEFEIPTHIIEMYIKELLYSSKKFFQSHYLIGRIDYNKPTSKRESSYIKYHLQYFLGYIKNNWEIPKYRKCIIAALVLIHFNLDRNIKTREEFDLVPTDSAQDYNHYIYDRMKNRFK
jgi:hypothetical protein